MNRVDLSQDIINNRLAVEAMRQSFSDFVDNTRDKIAETLATQEDNPDIYKNLDFLPRFCQNIIDTSYEYGIKLLYSEYEKTDKGTSVSCAVGDFITRNLARLEETEPNTADVMRFKIQQELAHTEDDVLLPLCINNIKQIIYMREEEEWHTAKVKELVYALTEPEKYDLPRQKYAKNTVRNDFFPENAIKPQEPPKYHPFKDIPLFYVKGEDISEDLTILPITSLYYDTLNMITHDENGNLKEMVKDSDLIHLSKAMHAMADIDRIFTLDFFTNSLIEYHSPKSDEIFTYMIADFVNQQSTIAYKNKEMSKVRFTDIMDTVDIWLPLAEEEVQKKVAFINLHGAIKYFSEKNNSESFIREQGKYLTAFKSDSFAQLEAKRSVARDLPNLLKP